MDGISKPNVFSLLQIYHFCHADGKQDTHHCPYGTIFNEYIGTCDHTGAAKCHSGEGYKAPPPPPHKPGYHEPPAGMVTLLF